MILEVQSWLAHQEAFRSPLPSANRAETAILAQRKDISGQILAKEKYISKKNGPPPQKNNQRPEKYQYWNNVSNKNMSLGNNNTPK